MKITKRQLRRIIKETMHSRMGSLSSLSGDTPEDAAGLVAEWIISGRVDPSDDEALSGAIIEVLGQMAVHGDDWPDWEDAVWTILDDHDLFAGDAYGNLAWPEPN